MNIESVKHDGEEFQVAFFDVPMDHEDFHKAEEAGFTVYLGYNRNGPDYWDDTMMLCKEADSVVAKKWSAEEW